MIDFINLRRSQSKQSTELLCAFGQLLVMDAYQDGPIMGHHRHALLDDSALKPFVTHLSCTS